MVIAVVAFGACAHTSGVARQGISAPTVSVADFGAIGDGVADDRAAIQAALNAGAGGTVNVPIGIYQVGKGAGAWNLSIPAGTLVIGESQDRAVLRQAPGMASSVRLLEIDGLAVRIQSLTLDGNRAAQDPGAKPDEHRAGVFARGADLELTDVTARNFTGDGFYFYGGAHRARLLRVITTANARNGATYGGTISGGWVTDSTFSGNGAQQLDSEPGGGGHVDGLVLRGNTFDGAGVSTDYVLTVCGSLTTTAAGVTVAPSTGWVITGNTINGALYTAWAADLAISGNTGINPTAKPWLVYRTASRVSLDHNTLVALASASAIAVIGTGTGQAADAVSVTNNRITAGGDAGIRVDGAVSISVTGNTITSSRGGGGAVAIALRATDQATPFYVGIVAANAATGWSRGLMVGGSGAARMSALVALGNSLGADYYLDDGSGALASAVVGGDPQPAVARWPAGANLSTAAGGTTVMWR